MALTEEQGGAGWQVPSYAETKEHGTTGDVSTGRHLKYTQLAPIKYRFASNASLSYHGMANFGVNASQPLWRIIRELHSGEIDAADGNDLFDNIWNDRDTLDYS